MTFIGFCLCTCLLCENFKVMNVLAFLEYLATNGIFANMFANYISTQGHSLSFWVSITKLVRYMLLNSLVINFVVTWIMTFRL